MGTPAASSESSQASMTGGKAQRLESCRSAPKRLRACWFTAVVTLALNELMATRAATPKVIAAT